MCQVDYPVKGLLNHARYGTTDLISSVLDGSKFTHTILDTPNYECMYGVDIATTVTVSQPTFVFVMM